MKNQPIPKQQQRIQVQTKIPIAVKISLTVMILAGISLAAGMFAVIFVKSKSPNVVFPEQSFTVTFQAGDYSISEPDEQGYREISMEGFNNISQPGEPALPTKIFQVLMPPGTKFKSLEIISSDTSAIDGDYLIKEAPTPQPITDSEESVELDYEAVEIVPPKKEIYQSDDPYPEKTVEQSRKGKMRKYNIQGIRFNPFHYKPLSGKLTLVEEVRVSIHYVQEFRASNEELQDTVMDEEAKKLLVNYDQFKDKYILKTDPVSKETTYDYLIIIPPDLVASQAITDLIAYREAGGFSVTVQDTDYIENNVEGGDLSEKIRNYLIENYLNWDLKYVALIGDNADIPMKYCSLGSSDNNIPTDYYYQDLTGIWDTDEYLCGDNIDLYPEVYVGRIPLVDVTQLENYVNRIIAYEESEDPYKHDVLLAAGRWYYADDAEFTAEFLINNTFIPNNYRITRMYEETGACPTTYQHDYDVSRTNVVSHWRDDHYGMVYFASHGTPTTLSSSPCSETDYNIFGTINVPELTDQYPSVIFANACSTAEPEKYNFSYVFLKNEAVSYVGSTRLGLTSDQIYKYYFENLINRAQLNGQALAEARLTRTFKFNGLDEALRFNLYSEPLLDICQDIDGDGYCASMDCDNHDGDINPGMPEICNGVDDDCNGLIDGEELQEVCGNSLDDDCDDDIDLEDSDCDCSVLGEYKCEKNGCSTGVPNNNYWCPVNHYCCRDCRDYYDKSCQCWRNTCDASTEEISKNQQNNN